MSLNYGFEGDVYCQLSSILFRYNLMFFSRTLPSSPPSPPYNLPSTTHWDKQLWKFIKCLVSLDFKVSRRLGLWFYLINSLFWSSGYKHFNLNLKETPPPLPTLPQLGIMGEGVSLNEFIP